MIVQGGQLQQHKKHTFQRVVKKIIEQRQKNRQKAQSTDNRLHPSLIVGDKRYRKHSYRLEEVHPSHKRRAFFSLTKHGVQFGGLAPTNTLSPHSVNHQTIHSHSNLFQRPSLRKRNPTEQSAVYQYSVSLSQAVKKSHHQCLITQSCHFQTKKKQTSAQSNKNRTLVGAKRIENYKVFGRVKRRPVNWGSSGDEEKFEQFVPWQTDQVEIDSLGEDV